LQRHGRHGEPRVAGQQRDEAVDVVGFEGVGEPLDQRAFRRGARRGRALPSGGEALLHCAAGPLEGALDRVLGAVEDGGDVGGVVAENVAE